MKYLSNYIIEKLRITRDIKLPNEMRFVLFYSKGNGDDALYHVVFGDYGKAKDFIKNLKYPKQYLDGYACENQYVHELIDKITRETKDVDDINDKWDEIQDFARRNNIVRFYDYKEVTEKLHLNKDTNIIEFAEDLTDIIYPIDNDSTRTAIIELLNNWLEDNNIDEDEFNKNVNIYSPEYVDEIKALNNVIKNKDFKSRISYHNIFLNDNINEIKKESFHLLNDSDVNMWIDDNRFLYIYNKDVKFTLYFIHTNYGTLG